MKAALTPSHHTFTAKAFIENLGDEIDDEEKGLKIAKDPVYAFAANIVPYREVIDSGIPDIENTPNYHEKVKRNILFTKHISKQNAHLSIRRYDWKQYTVYTQWSHNKNSMYPETWLSESQPCYVFVDTINEKQVRSVFMCLSNNGGKASLVPPDKKDFHAFDTPDGYIWKFMYEITDDLFEEWANSDFIPIPTSDDEITERNKELLNEYNNIKDDSSLKNITEIKITDYGEGYERAHKIQVEIEGDGTGAYAELRWEIKEGTTGRALSDWIPKIYLIDGGKGYNTASVNISCYDKDIKGEYVVKRPMKAEAVINPITFLGSDILNDMHARFVSMKVDFYGNEGETDRNEDIYKTNGGNFPTAAAYRQVGLIKNVKKANGDPLLNDKPRYFDIMKIDNVTGQINSLTIIQGIESNAKARVWYSYHDSSDVMYLYLIDRTDEFKFNALNYTKSEEISDVNTNVMGRIRGLVEKNMDPLAGELMYIENTTDIYRSRTQKEVFLFTIEF